MDLAQEVTAWAKSTDDVSGLVLIGSRQHRNESSVRSADRFSDWDFQVITRAPRRYIKQGWLEDTSLGLPKVQVCRRGILGQSDKVTAIWPGMEADFVIISAQRLRLARWAMRLGWHHRSSRLRAALAGLALVIRSGFDFLYDTGTWNKFYQLVVAEVDDPRLNNDQIRMMADGFACDYLWVQRKIERGELLAAQRMLHASLVETNFRLQHELRLRSQRVSLPDVRRAEMILSSEELNALAVNSAPDAALLSQALAKVSATMRGLMAQLNITGWIWPW